MIVKYLTLDEIIAIHDSMIDIYGGSHGIRDLGLLQSALARPQASFSGEDLYPNIFDKASALFHSLMFNHVFVDGNKRTTFVGTARFLSLNGYEITARGKDVIVFALEVENKYLSIEKIAGWLRKNSKKNKV